jgi:threonine/homoserine/homoserine lactone efflux protein
MLEGARLGLFFAAATLLLLTPGPAVLYIVARSIHQGRVAGLVSMLGIAVGTLVHVLAAALGLSALLASSAAAYAVIKYAGAAYLVFLGLRQLLRREPEEAAQAAPPERLRRIFGNGILVNVLNPKTALFFLAFLPQFVDVSRGSVSGQLVLLGLLFTIMGMTSDAIYAILAGTAGGWLRANRRFTGVQRYVTGGVYVGLGVAAAFVGPNRK